MNLPEFKISINDLRQCTGKVVVERTVPIENILSKFGIDEEIVSDRVAFTIYWPEDSPNLEELPALRVSFRVDHASDESEEPEVNQAGRGRRRRRTAGPTPAAQQSTENHDFSEFSTDVTRYHNMMIACGYSRDMLSGPEMDFWLKRNHLGSVVVDRKAKIVVTLELDTDCDGLLSYISNIAYDGSKPDWQHTDLDVKLAEPTEAEYRQSEQEEDVLEDDEFFATLSVFPQIRIIAFPSASPVSPEPDYIGWLIIEATEFNSLPKSNDFAAIDFGNNASSFALMKETETALEALKVICVDPARRYENDGERAKGTSVKSVVYVDEYQQPATALSVNSLQYTIGARALEEEKQDGLILGAKKWLVTDESAEQLKVTIDNLTVPIPNKLPTELIVNSLLKEFYFTSKAQPGSIVVTYPCTFSSWEIIALRNTVARAINRSLCFSEHGFTDAWEESRVPQMMDEATAAAFFFLYKDYIDGESLRALAYVFEHGVNVLIIDVGGGTTDIALVNCSPKPREGVVQWQVCISVLGRTGLKEFGGDEITNAVARVLKARLAEYLSSGAVRIPDDPNQFAAWYRVNHESINKEVPTQFANLDPENDRDAYRLAREATRDLWTWAEDVKVWISKAPPNVDLFSESTDIDTDSKNESSKKVTHFDKFVKHSPFPSPPSQGDAKLWQAIHSRRSDRKSEVYQFALDQLPKIMIESIEHVDAQIANAVDACVENANRMISERLTDSIRLREKHQRLQHLDAPPADSEVHRVYIVGNASRYPLIRRKLIDGLNFPIHNHRFRKPPEPVWESTTEKSENPHLERMVFDPDNLKASVVKGAVLARLVTRKNIGALFEWDQLLSRRLPYSVYFNSAVDGWIPKFFEHERYDVIVNDYRKLPDPTREARTNQMIALGRKWPGDPPDAKPQEFLVFKFSKGFKGPLNVVYRENSDEFIGFEIIDEGTGEVCRGVPVVTKDLLPLMQRGDL